MNITQTQWAKNGKIVQYFATQFEKIQILVYYAYLKALSNIGKHVPVVAAGFEQKFLIMKFPAAGIFQKRNTIQLTAIIGIITSLCSFDKLFQYSFNLFLHSPYCKKINNKKLYYAF